MKTDCNTISSAEKNNYTLTVILDEEPMNPREDFDNLGTMVCWHRRYNLGDKHNYDSPEEFLRSLLFSVFCVSPNHVFDFIKSGRSKYANIKYNASTRETELYSVEYTSEMLVVSYPAKLNKQNLVPEWFLDSCLELLSMDELLMLTELAEGLVILPLYLYDHGGITMNTTGFYCPWDSGQVGWIYAEREDILKNYGEKRLPLS